MTVAAYDSWSPLRTRQPVRCRRALGHVARPVQNRHAGESPAPLTYLTPRETTSLATTLNRLNPYRVIRIGVDRRTIWEFWKVGCSATRGMGALDDPTVPRQMALIWARDDADTFTLQWYPNAEEPQIVADLPIARLHEAVADLRAAGFC